MAIVANHAALFVSTYIVSDVLASASSNVAWSRTHAFAVTVVLPTTVWKLVNEPALRWRLTRSCESGWPGASFAQTDTT